MSVLAIEALGVRFGARSVLDGVSLRVAAGEVVALVGRSGAGKSTLLAAVTGLLPPGAVATGSVRLAGDDLLAMDEAARRRRRGVTVGLVMQDPGAALDPAMRIGAQVVEAARLHRRLSRREGRPEAARLLAEVGLDVPADRYPHQLSGGQRQRVAIAAAIAAGPALLLADEPTAALDPVARADIAALLARLARERGMGLLLVTHDLALVAGLADRLVVLEGGAVVVDGSVPERLAHPASPVLRALTAAERDGPPPAAAFPAPPLLALEGVSRRFRSGDWLHSRRHDALVGADLQIDPGETVALVGPSGSGKTTLVRLALGLDRPDGGVVRLAGADRARLRGIAARQARATVQAVFQDPAGSLDPVRTVADSVAEPLGLLPVRPSPAERRARVAEALGQAGLDEAVAARLPHALSGGQQQRVALARALVLRPPLLVLDEAMSALDPGLRAELAERLRRLQAERGTAMLLVTHDLGLVRRLAHRVVVLRAGRVVEEGPVQAVLAAPRDPFTAALVAASPTLDEALSRRAAPPSAPTDRASPPR